MTTAGRALLRPMSVVVAATVVFCLAILPWGDRQLGPSASFLPAMLSLVACFDLLTVYLLIGDYRDRGDPRLLMMSWAYAWSLVVMAGYALAFPGAFVADAPLAANASTAPYLYVAWHGGFPALLGLAWARWPARWLNPTPEATRRRLAAATIMGAMAVGTATVAVLVLAGDHLPVLINGRDTRRMTALTAPVVLPVALLALATVVAGTRRCHGPHRWTSVAALVCVADLVLTYGTHYRYSLGWYGGRSLTLVAAGVLLVAMLSEFREVKARAEHDAAIDHLTGLWNRRTVYPTLERLVAAARRSGGLLGVVALDLDWFKRINDHYGHEMGDRVLVEVGRQLELTCRRSDVAGRMGGEEFVILLPDTDLAGTIAAAERIRLAVEAMTVPGLPERLTISAGATVWRADEEASGILSRVDTALYEAKRSGRNRVASLEAADQGTPPPALRPPATARAL